MKNILSTTILTILVAFTCADHANADAPAGKPSDETTKAAAVKDTAVIEQAIPVVALLRSVKESDAALFQECWDKPMAERMGLTAESAKKMVEQYKRGFDQAFGEYLMADFSYTFTGDAEVGTITVKFKDKNVPPLKVIKSGNVWKLGEK